MKVAQDYEYPPEVHLELRFQQGVLEKNTYLGVTDDNLMQMEFIMNFEKASKRSTGFFDMII